VVYGKVYGDDRGRLVGPVLTALRQLLDGPGPSLPFQVPRFQAYLPDLRLTLLESVPGAPLLPALIRARAGVAGAPAFPGLTPEQAVVSCARVAAALHRSSVPVGRARTLTEEIDAVRARVDALAPMAPALAATLQRHLAAVGHVGLDAPGPLGVAHGDFNASQVLFGGRSTSLVDFDSVCRAEPALDLGRFTAHLAATIRKAPRSGEVPPDGSADLERVFLREYLDASGAGDPDTLLPRVAAYRTVALVGLAIRSWCKLKPQRLRPLLSLLDEPKRIGVP
jgi:aminoglycoside phosphotransferase (APT) family kinase protein